MSTTPDNKYEMPSASASARPSASAASASEGGAYTALPSTAAEEYSGGKLMVIAYATIWFALMGWLLMMWLKQGSLAQRLAGLESAIDRAEARAQKAAASKDK